MGVKLLSTLLFVTIIGACKSISDRKIDLELSTQAQSRTAPPCIAPDPLNPNWSEKEKLEWQQEYSRRVHGYQSDITLSEAVEQFNRDAKCHQPVGKDQPPLTTKELLAAVQDVRNYDKKSSPSAIKQLERIVSEQVMPKGSLLWYDWGYTQDGKYRMRYWKIYLYLDLDKHPLDEKIDRNSILVNKHLVRLQYIASEMSN